MKKVRFHNGKLVAEPDFEEHGVRLYPIPDALQEEAQKKLHEGDVVVGHVGKLYYTGRNDKHDVPIFLHYFFPDFGKVA